MTLTMLKSKLPQSSSVYSSIYPLQTTPFLSDVQPLLDSCLTQVEVREYSISIIIPNSNSIEAIDPLIQHRALSNLMAQMNQLFDGVSLFPHLSQYKSAVSQQACQSELLLKSWTHRELLLDSFEEVLEQTVHLGRVLRQEKMTLFVETLGERLMIRLATNIGENLDAIA